MITSHSDRAPRARRRIFACAILLGLLPGLAAAIDREASLVIEGFTLRISDETGMVTHVLRGERMRQFDRQGFQEAENPHLQLLSEGSVEWVWTSPLAVHYPNEQRLQLVGLTRGVRLPSGEIPRTEIETADVTVFTDSQQAVTQARATLSQPGLFMTGTGMHADAPTDRIRLLNDVRTLYSPEELEESRE